MMELKERDKRDVAYPKFDGRLGSQGVQHERVAKAKIWDVLFIWKYPVCRSEK